MSNNSSPSTIAPSPTGSTGLALKPAPTQTLTKIVTSKEWVLPPRPKPGRKPSADTPATKRKAQNRAAQRAFRERRATRVTELEEKLSEVEKEKEINELNFRNIVNKLQSENKFLLKALNDIKSDFANFKQSVLAQPNHIISNNSTPPNAAVFTNGQLSSAPSPLNYFKPTSGTPNSLTSPEDGIKNYKFPQQQQYPQPSQPQHRQYPGQVRQQSIQPLSPLNPNARSPHDTQSFSANPTPSTKKSSISSPADENFDCGVCVKDDCICAQVGLKPATPKATIENFQAMAPVSLKRKHTEEAEVDYTAKFSKVSSTKKPMPKFKKSKSLQPLQNNAGRTNGGRFEDDSASEFSTVFDKITDDDFHSPMEQCGFCSDDSPCVCREAAKEAANAITELQNHSRRESQQQQQQQQQQQATLPPISRHSSVSQINKLPVLHPGPSVEISEIHRSSISTPKDSTDTMDQPQKTAGCTGNPGTCTQCQMDPMSTLFCTTIASKAEEDTKDDTSVTKGVTSNGQETVNPSPTSSASAVTAARQLEDGAQKSPVSPPLSNVSSKVSSPLTVTSQEEELNSLIKKSASTPSAGGSAKGIYIPCADAYKTLSRHKEFNSVDFSTLVGKLNTRGMQVEVQSVANVLRELDRRLYN